MNDLVQAESRPVSLLARVADRFGVEPSKMMATLKATAFKGNVSNEQMMALLIVADQHGLNPWTKEIYAFPDKGGIVPVVGVDGWSRIINTHPQFDGMEFSWNDAEQSMTCTIHRKDRDFPVSVTEYMAECNRKTGPWQTHPRRMLRHKAMIQCARVTFGFSGIYDPDEADRIVLARKRVPETTTLADITAEAEDGEIIPPVPDDDIDDQTPIPGFDDVSPPAEPQPEKVTGHQKPDTMSAITAINKAVSLTDLDTIWTRLTIAYNDALLDPPRPVVAAHDSRKKQLTKEAM